MNRTQALDVVRKLAPTASSMIPNAAYPEISKKLLHAIAADLAILNGSGVAKIDAQELADAYRALVPHSRG
jgi:hypothetical protein